MEFRFPLSNRLGFPASRGRSPRKGRCVLPQRISLQLFTVLFLATSSVAVVTAQDPDAAPAAESAGDGTNLSDLLDIKINEHVKVKLGAGARISLRATENGAENGSNWSEDVNLDNLRLYLSASAYDWFGLEFNTDIGNAQGFEDAGSGFEEAGNLRVLDAVGKIEPCDYFKLWFGRFLPPSDRANLSGPFFTTVWDFPYTQFGYYNIFQGRDDGVAIWGEMSKDELQFGQLKWQLGAFEGQSGRGATDPNDDDNTMFTGRLVLNLWDEEPGYYNSSTYYGDKDILALGLAGMHQEDATGIQGAEEDYTGFSFDVLMEKKLTADVVGNMAGLTDGVVTLDAAYYNFDDGDSSQVDPGGLFTPVTRQGESWFVTLAYLVPSEINCGVISGQLQPYYRHLNYNRDVDVAGTTGEGHDFGLNFILKGHAARLTLAYQTRDGGPQTPTSDQFLLGAQLNF